MNGFGLINMSRPKGEYEQELRVTLGRVYDPKVGRFLSPDPILQNSSNTQNMNRYSYVWNNPLKYVDPSGYYNQAAASIGGSSETGQVSIGTGNWYGTGGGGSIFPKMGTSDGPTSDLEYDIALAQSFDGILGGTFYMDAMRTSVSNGYYNRGSVQELSRSFVYTNGNFTGVNIYYGYVIDSGMSADDANSGGVDAMDVANYVVSNAGTLTGAAQFTVNSMSNKQQWKYAYKASKYLKGKGVNVQARVIKHGTSTVLKNASRKITIVGGALAVGDVLMDGQVNASHILNVAMVGISAIPVVGWIAGGAYFVADMITWGVSDQTIGQHLDNAVGDPIINDIYNWSN